MTTTLEAQKNSSVKTELLFDIESTGLLRRGSKIHCIVMRNVADTAEPEVFDHLPERTLVQGVKALEKADALIGHNIIGYDIPLLNERYSDFNPSGEIIDTLILSRIFYPKIEDRDYERRPEGMPQHLYGRHSLKAWGYRLKCFKGDFGNDKESWKEYTPEMLDYCIQDTEVTYKLYQMLMRRMSTYE